jgi:F-type H+-transporting ATPase subunit b
MDTTKYPSQLFWLIVFFGLLYWLMTRILPRIGSILANRKAKIDGDLARAQALKNETESAIKAYEKALADARSSANDIAKQTREAVTREIDAEQAKINASLSAKITEAEQRIAASKKTAMDSVSQIAAESAADIVAALGGGKTKAAKG